MIRTLRIRQFSVGCMFAVACVLNFAEGASTLASPAEPQDEPARPNVILIMTDDQGYGDMSCHGNPYLQTPGLDGLYRDSVRLTDFHVDPTCSPTRAALLTGRYSSRVGVWLTYGSRHHLRRSEVCLADVFRESGYRTAVFGKWHLGDNYPFRPTDRGFDEALIHGGGMIGETPDYWNNDYYDDTYFRNHVPEQVDGYCTDVWFREATAFVKRNRDQPFFLYLPTNAPHGPLHVPAAYVDRFLNDPDIPASRAHFYGMIECIDENIARLQRELASLQLERNTILVFLNDNGTGSGVTLTSAGKPDRNGWVDPNKSGAGFNAGMRGRKGSVYEGGHRAACFLRWPGGNLTGGRDVGGLTSHIDLMPTLIDLCSLKSGRDVQFDGQSLADSLRDPHARVATRTLVVHHQGRFGRPLGDGLPIHGKDYSVMRDRWRLVGDELFDLSRDPSQRSDVADQFPVVASRLKSEYEHWWRDISADFDKPNAFVINPARQQVVKISSQNLLGGRVAYSQHHVRNAMSIEGGWTWIDVEVPGRYEITVRRWPAEANLAMSDTSSVHPIDPARHEETNKLMNLPSVAIPVTHARLQVGGFDQLIAVGAEDRETQFVVDLDQGLQKIEATLQTADGTRTAAYYLGIEPHTTD